MAENFYTILTNVGLAKFANSQVTGDKINLTEIAVGDGDGKYYNPTSSQSELRKEVWRGNIASIDIDESNPNWIVIETVIPSEDGGFMVREVGVFDDDGDMIAIGKYPETFKPILNQGSAKDLYIRMIIEVSNASSVTLRIDPSVIIASKKYVDEKHQASKNYTDMTKQQLEQKLETLQQKLGKLDDLDTEEKENLVAAINDVLKALSEHKAEIASQDVGKGADIIGLPDPDNLFTAISVGEAMQELFTNVSNGKEIIRNAITDKGGTVMGSGEDGIPTFIDLQSAINNVAKWDRDLIASNIRERKNIFGVTGNLVEGKKYATGIVTGHQSPFTVNGLSFRPRIVIIQHQYDSITTAVLYNGYDYPDHYLRGGGTSHPTSPPPYGSFSFAISTGSSTNRTYRWWAFD